jgi:uncharacterized membrane protein
MAPAFPALRPGKDALLALCFALLTAALWFVPTGFEERIDKDAVRARAEVLETEDSGIRALGMVLVGEQQVELEMKSGELAGQRLSGVNTLLGQMDRDKIFAPGDEALVVITRDAKGNLENVVPYEHYRIGLELWLLGMFAALLVAFGGWTGVKALLSFAFAALALWKLLVPLLLKGADPVWLALGLVATLCGAIIFLVAGPTKKGLVAFAGAFLGVLSSCVLAVFFAGKLHVHGAVMPFASTLLYSGFEHLDLTRIYVAAVFLAASGAVMDLAMDVSASMAEVVERRPDISRGEALLSGLRVGRAVVGTMTTTLLLAYSGGYITLLMAFMAQGVPLANTFNLVYVAAEVLKTLVGSFGLVLVAPFTAMVGALVFVRQPGRWRVSRPARGARPNPGPTPVER